MRKSATIAILSLHCVFVLLLLLQPQWKREPKKHKSLVVKTITPPARVVAATKSPPRVSPKKTPAIPPKSAASQPSKPAGKPNPSVKPVAAPPPANKKSSAVEPAISDKVVAAKKTAPARSAPERARLSDALVKELEESLAKWEDKPTVSSATSPKKTVVIPQLEIDSAEVFVEDSYEAMLVSCLKTNLALPGYGEVKIQLHLRQDGSVIKMVVLNAQSQENRRYLEQMLPVLRFPPFEGALRQDKERSFVLAFTNG